MALHHDNLAITDLRSEARVAAEGVETEFSVTVQNFSSNDRKTFLHVKVDGKEDFAGSRPIDRIPADGSVTEKFTLIFAKKKPSAEVQLRRSAGGARAQTPARSGIRAHHGGDRAGGNRPASG